MREVFIIAHRYRTSPPFVFEILHIWRVPLTAMQDTYNREVNELLISNPGANSTIYLVPSPLHGLDELAGTELAAPTPIDYTDPSSW